MATKIGFGPSLRGMHFEEWHVTMTLAAGIVVADEGKAVALDTGAANKAKLAGDGDQIIGRLEKVENRVQEGILVGTIALKFSNLLPIKASLSGAEVVAIGSTVVGAGSGEVKARVVSSAAAPDYTINMVSQLVTISSVAYAVVTKG